MEEVKRIPVDPLNSSANREFAKMEICHHCKLLHPESALVRCEYRSSRCGNPVPPSPYYDSYVYQVIKSHHGCYPDEQARVTALRMLNGGVGSSLNQNGNVNGQGNPSCSQIRKNSYFHYVKKGISEVIKDD